MTDTTTKVKLANRALIRLNKGLISSLTEATQTATYVNQVFDEVAEGVIAEGDWSFARKRLELGQDASTPAFDYSYQHTLPSDFVKIVSINEAQPGLYDFKIEGTKLLSDKSGMKILYIYNNLSVQDWPATFKECFVTKLALELSYLFRSDKVLTRGLEESYERTLRKMLALDGGQDTSDLISTTELLDVR